MNLMSAIRSRSLRIIQVQLDRSNRYPSLLFLVLAIAFSFLANESKAIDIRAYWKVGESRDYVYKLGDVLIGTQTATFREVRQSSSFGLVAVFDMSSEQNLAAVGEDRRLSYTCEIHYAVNGTPVAYEATYVENYDTSSIRFELRGNLLQGTSHGISEDTVVSMSVPPGTFICDQNFVAHWQMVVGTIPMSGEEGRKLDIVVPRAARRVPIIGRVTGSELVRREGRDVPCTLFEIREGNLKLYVDSTATLLRAIDTRRNLVMDLVAELENVEQPQKSGFPSMARIGVWIVFAVVALVFIRIFAAPAFRDRWLWVLFVVTGLAFLLVIYVQAPLQREILKAAFKSFGTGAVLASFLSALIAALFQESIKYGALRGYLHFASERPRLLTLVMYGAAAGIGFGFVESCWLAPDLAVTGLSVFASVVLAERVLFIVFHASTGAILGFGIGRRMDLLFWLLAVILHFFARFLFVLLTTGHVDAFFYGLFLAIYCGAVLYAALKLKIKVRSR